MNRNNLIIIAVIGGLILLGLGYSYGLFTTQKGLKELQQAPTALSELLASKVIRGLSTSATGDITAISGRSLTLTAEGDTLTILIREDAPIYRLVPPEEIAIEIPQPVAREEITLGEIKVGDKVNISCQLKADGSLEGTEVTVLP